jgi:hypothetical protein
VRLMPSSSPISPGASPKRRTCTPRACCVGARKGKAASPSEMAASRRGRSELGVELPGKGCGVVVCLALSVMTAIGVIAGLSLRRFGFREPGKESQREPERLRTGYVPFAVGQLRSAPTTQLGHLQGWPE